jgi:hypothetical protein
MRIEDIRNQMLKGMVSRTDILRYITEKYGIKEDQIDKDVAKAKDLIRQSLDNTDRNFLIAQSIERYNILYYKNFKLQDYRECRQIVGDINKLFGLNEPEKLDHSTQGEKIPQIIIGYRPTDDSAK